MTSLFRRDTFANLIKYTDSGIAKLRLVVQAQAEPPTQFYAVMSNLMTFYLMDPGALICSIRSLFHSPSTLT